eukprot:Tbor_TRINITY_DN6068_c2_g1::TRINITY_DN6068_c2_g1_i1::g.10712::m.10712
MVERTADGRIRTSEWEDIQYKHGNRVGKYRDNEMQLLAQRISDANPNVELKPYDPNEEKVRDKAERGGFDVDPRNAEAVLEARDEDGSDAEDAIDAMMDDDEALAAFRRKRTAELKRMQATHVYGVVKHIPGGDYVSEITQASANCWVVAVMMKLGNADCDLLLTIMRQAASRNRDVKFVSLVALEAIPNFPEKHLPCVLLYHKGEMIQQTTTNTPWSENPDKEKSPITLTSVEKALQRHGVICREEYEPEEDYNAEFNEKYGYRSGDLLRRK